MKMIEKYPRAWTLLEGLRAGSLELETLEEQARRLRARAQRVTGGYSQRISGAYVDREALLARALDAETLAKQKSQALDKCKKVAAGLLQRLPLPVDAMALRLMYLNGCDKTTLRAALCLSRGALQARVYHAFASLEALMKEAEAHEHTA